ncbi:hypothetical protein AKJ41_02115 [candidate division MSBL1 archaeon SCGC-AAA259O05]|uniref:ArnR1-like winged helix-turn-helix domain-containing protein n=1 Tax=candidate division MSBL1 archaeon SCGC-AAA259O05 TaxID=1698271 RepID=A0A133V4B4_9EURY|nr:hypothetical protein AKJ41_02115 [candidate division MSBL1 archaeon SCGC-AAA259O05]
MRRDELRILADVLRNADEETASSIAGSSNQNYERCREKLDRLLANNLMREKEIAYKTTDSSKSVYLRTEKGNEFLEKLRELEGMTGISSGH